MWAFSSKLTTRPGKMPIMSPKKDRIQENANKFDNLGHAKKIK